MKLGFTGTQEGMTAKQRAVLRKFLADFSIPWGGTDDLEEFNHGDCIGADDQAATLVHKLVPECPIHSHPCYIKDKRAHNPHSTFIHPVKPPLERNVIIVKRSTHMIATPKGQEEIRSGTWYTIRQSKKLHVPLMIIMPHGKVELC